jgi:thiamine pyrophosphokinase
MGSSPLIASRDVEIFSNPVPRRDHVKKTLFILGGRPPVEDWLRDFASRNSPDVWAVDSGVAPCRAIGAVPSEIIGDRDSADHGDWEWAVSVGARERLFHADKDRTDFQLALSLFEENLEKNASHAHALILSGCFGGFLDHLASAFDTLALCEKTFSRCMIDDREGVFFICGGSVSLKFAHRPSAVSLLPVTDACRGVCISGVKWPLYGSELERRMPWAVSNEARPDEAGEFAVTASCSEGTLAVCWRFG